MRSSAILKALCVLAAVFLVVPGHAQSKEWKVEGKLQGKRDKDDHDKIKHAQDVSGIACNSESGFPRQCVVIDDETQRAQVVIVHDDKIVAGQPIQLISHSFNGEPVELDGEGVAYEDGYFYVIGSHGSPRDSKIVGDERDARIAANSQLLRFRIDKDDITKDGRLKETPRIEATAKLRAALRKVPALKAEENLDKDGLTIEGVAVKDGILYAGLRGPPLPDGKAAIASLPVKNLFDGKASLPDLHIDPVSVGEGNGIRDLIRYKNGFVVLVGPSGDLKEGDPGKYFVVRWPGQGDVVGPRTPVEVVPADKDDKAKDFLKPEAILVLDEDGSDLRLLVLCDGAREGRPRTMTMR